MDTADGHDKPEKAPKSVPDTFTSPIEKRTNIVELTLETLFVREHFCRLSFVVFFPRKKIKKCNPPDTNNMDLEKVHIFLLAKLSRRQQETSIPGEGAA